MLKSYDAIYENGLIQWLGKAPRLSKAQVMVVFSEPEEGDISEKPKTNGPMLAKILQDTDPKLLKSLSDKFGDPVEWQREQRKDRPLPGREES